MIAFMSYFLIKLVINLPKGTPMNLVKRTANVFTESWFKTCHKKEEIPNNTMFHCYFFDTAKKETPFTVKFYVKIEDVFYGFSRKDDRLIKLKKNDTFLLTNSLNEVIVENISTEDMDDFWKKYIQINQDQYTKESDLYVLTEEDIKAFAINGIEAKPVDGARNFMKRSSRIDYDGVQYCIAFHSNNFEQNIKSISHSLDHFYQTKERHHHLVKAIYQHLTENSKLGHIWAMMGGGSQIQVFFGNESGYLGILYLDMDKKEENKDIDYSTEQFILSIENSAMDDIFNDFSHPLIKCRK